MVQNAAAGPQPVTGDLENLHRTPKEGLSGQFGNAELGGMKKAHHMETLTSLIKSDSLSEVWSLKSDTTG